MRYWYHSEEKNSVVTIAAEQLRALIRSGTLKPGVMVWREGMDRWRPACEVPDLRVAPPAVPGRTGEDSVRERPVSGSGANVPDPIPESCEACDRFTRVSTVNPAKGYCAFYEVKRYADNECYAHELLSSEGGKTPGGEAGDEDGELSGPRELANGSAGSDAWLYRDGSEQHGPLRRETIREMLEAGALSSDTLLWSEGLSDWTPASQLEAFKRAASARASAADGAAANRAAKDDAVPQKRPWVRYFARTIDGMLVGFAAGIVAALIYPPLLEAGDALMGLLALFLFVFVEPFLLANWGTTPGKSLLRTSVLDKEGGFLSYSAALRRSFGVWLKGLGAGIPLVSLFTLGISYLNFKDDGVTSWDEQAGSVVVHRRIGAGRVAVAVVVVLIMVSLMVIGQQI